MRRNEPNDVNRFLLIMVLVCYIIILIVTSKLIEVREQLQKYQTMEAITTTAPIIPTQVVYEPAPVEMTINEDDAIALAQMAWGEARGCSTMEQAATMWCVLNRVDATGYAMEDDILSVVTFPNQFVGYSPNHPVTDDLYNLAVDVLTRWQLEKQGTTDVGRVLPADYLFFYGDGKRNHFRKEFDNFNETWDWSSPNPYEEVVK